MLRQYRAQRRRGGHNPHGVGTISIGSIFYLQDGLGRRHAPVICRNPWIVVAWHNREYHPAVRGQPHTTYMVGGHLATVRSLRDGREQKVADWFLLAHEEAGFEAAAGVPLPIPVLPGREYRPLPVTEPKPRRRGRRAVA